MKGCAVRLATMTFRASARNIGTIPIRWMRGAEAKLSKFSNSRILHHSHFYSVPHRASVITPTGMPTRTHMGPFADSIDEPVRVQGSNY